MLLGVVAYGHFVRGELETAIEVGERAIAEAERLGSLTAGLAERALGNAYFFRLQQTEALGLMERMVAAAYATGAPAFVAHAYYMCSVAQTSIGNPESGREFAALERDRGDRERESHRARAGRLRARDLARGGGPGSCPRPVRPQRRSAASRSATAGSAPFSLTESLWIRAQQGDPIGALAGYRDVIDTWFRGSDSANLWLSLRYVAAILASLERDEPAAVLYGALDAAGAVAALPLEPSSADEFALVVKRVTERLDPTVLADAIELGRTLGVDEVVRYAAPRARRVVAELDGERGGPGELGRTVRGAGGGGEVLGETALLHQPERSVAQVVGEVVAAPVAAAPGRWPSWC